MEISPALFESFELRKRLFSGTSMQSETASMFSHPLAFILEVVCRHLGQGFHGGFQRGWSGDDFPGALALDNALDQTFLSGRGEQAPVQFAEFTFSGIVGARQAGDIVR